jgi:hypothetical protein
MNTLVTNFTMDDSNKTPLVEQQSNQQLNKQSNRLGQEKRQTSKAEIFGMDWFNEFEKYYKQGNTNYEMRAKKLSTYFNKYFQHDRYKTFTCERASIGYLCRALANNISIVDTSTEFGKKFFKIIKVCVHFLEQLKYIHKDSFPGDVELKYGKYENIDIYIETFIEPRYIKPRHNDNRKNNNNNNNNKNKRRNHGTEHIQRASTVTLIKELLQRTRFTASQTWKRKFHSQYSCVIDDGFKELKNWLPCLCERTVEYQRNGRKQFRKVRDDPFFYMCLHFMKKAQEACRVEKAAHSNKVAFVEPVEKEKEVVVVEPEVVVAEPEVVVVEPEVVVVEPEVVVVVEGE